MEIQDRFRPRAPRQPGRFLPALLFAILAWVPSQSQAAPATLVQSDLALAVYASPDGATWSALGASALAGFFGPHRCLCPDTLSVQVALTSSGQTNLGGSTLAANFLLGANCQTTPAACVSVGQVSFSGSQTAASPTFSSSLVFQSVAGTGTVACASLTAGSTTLWAILAQDGVALSFALSLDLPVLSTTVGAPTAVTAQPANQGILVAWTPPADASLVAGYQVLCLPPPPLALTAGYESCGLGAGMDAGLFPADTAEVCSAVVSATTTSTRLTGLTNGTPYSVAVIAIDPSGGVSTLSPTAQAIPQPTMGFYGKYKQDGGAATGCSLAPSPPARRPRLLWMALAVAAVLLPGRCRRRGARGSPARAARVLALLLAGTGTAQAQIPQFHADDEWAAAPAAPRMFSPPDWGFELGVSLYRPAVDSELGNGVHPFADTFSNSRHLLSEAELDRYLGHRFGTWGVGLRAGYYKVTAAAFLADGVTRSGDETGLRLIPCSLSLLYRADGLPGLQRVPVIPYAKAGLDGVLWTATSTGDSASQTGFSLGWHVAAGTMLGLNFLADGAIHPGALADPCALFFEWDYAAINGLGFGHTLHVGDSTWFAGIMFDL